MEQSAFVKWVEKYLPGVTLRITKKLNDSTNTLPYLFKILLQPKFSGDGKWETLIQENTLISADYVAMDSDSPLKSRDSIGKASGDIPKMSMELWLNEKQLTDLDSLINNGASDAQIVAELFKDSKKVIGGAYELNEGSFLQGFSTGEVLVTDADNVGTGIRLNYGYLPANRFGVTKALTDPTYKYWDDVRVIRNKSIVDGAPIEVAYTDSATIDAICALDQTKRLFVGRQMTDISSVADLDLEELNALAKKKYGFVYQRVDRTIRRQKNKTKTTFVPWKAGTIIYTTSGQVGSLVYAKLAEQNHPVAGVIYELVDGIYLISKYRKNEPAVSEYTKMQARVVPVIDSVEEIYSQDTTLVTG